MSPLATTAWRKILLATDFSDSSSRALELAIQLSSDVDTGLTLLHVWEIPVYPYPELAPAPIDLLTPVEQAARADLSTLLEKVKKRIPRAESELRMGSPAEEIISAAVQRQSELVVVGTHGRRGPSRVLLGSVAERVLRLSRVPVLAVPTPERQSSWAFPWRKLCCPIDFSNASTASFNLAVQLARAFDAGLTLLHVYEPPQPAIPEGRVLAPPEFFQELVNVANQQLEQWKQRAQGQGVKEISAALVSGSPFAEIVRFTSEGNFDLTVMGTRGRTGLKHLVLGSVTERVVRLGNCPVLAVHPPR